MLLQASDQSVSVRRRKNIVIFWHQTRTFHFRLPAVCAGNNARKIARGWDGQGIIMYNVYDF